MIADNKSVNMGRVVSWGNPYHGTVDAGTLTLPNGATMPFTAGGECILVALNGTPAPMASNTPADAAAGLRWDNYALLQDPTKAGYLYYPGDNAAGTETPILVNWCYKDSTGKAWRLGNTLVNGGNKATRYVRILGKRVATGEAFAQIATLAVPNEPADMGAALCGNPIPVPAPDGTKCLFVFPCGALGMSAVVEVTASGGNDATPPTFSSAVLIEGAAAYASSDVSTLLPATKPLFHVSISGWVETATSEQVENGDAGLRREIHKKKLLGGCYDDAGTPVLFKYTYDSLFVPFSVTTVSPTGWTVDSQPGPSTDTVTTTKNAGYDKHIEIGITGGAASISYTVDYHSEATSHEQRTLSGSTTTLPTTTTFDSYFGGTLLPFHGPPTGWFSSIFDTVSPASGDFLDALQPVIYSRTVVGLGLPDQTTVQNWLDDDSNLIISIPAYHALAWSVIGPKSGSATPVTRTATGGKFPVVAHPITGAFAYGTGSGFV